MDKDDDNRTATKRQTRKTADGMNKNPKSILELTSNQNEMKKEGGVQRVKNREGGGKRKNGGRRVRMKDP